MNNFWTNASSSLLAGVVTLIVTAISVSVWKHQPSRLEWQIAIFLATGFLLATVWLIVAWKKKKDRLMVTVAELAEMRKHTSDVAEREAILGAKEDEWSELIRSFDLRTLTTVLMKKRAEIVYYIDQKKAADALQKKKLYVVDAIPDRDIFILSFHVPPGVTSPPLQTAMELVKDGNVIAEMVQVIEEPDKNGQGKCAVFMATADQSWAQSVKSRYMFDPVQLDDIEVRPILHPGLVKYPLEQLTRRLKTLDKVIEEMQVFMGETVD